MLQFGVSHQGWLPGPLPLNVDILSPVSPHLLAPAAPMFLNKQKIAHSTTFKGLKDLCELLGNETLQRLPKAKTSITSLR